MDEPEDVEKVEAPTDAAPYLTLIKRAQKRFQVYQDKCDNIDKLYADLEKLAANSQEREFQIFWANLEVLKPSIYSRPPVPVVTPRHKDRKELPRVASEILERTLETSFDLNDINSTMLAIRDDVAMHSRGVPWVRYEATETEAGLVEKALTEPVDRADFLHDPARSWAEVEWVARRAWLSRKKGLERFGDVFLSASVKKPDGDEDCEAKAEVWEIWHKTEGAVIWVAPGVDRILDHQPPFLQFEGFFPCPKPAYGTVKRRSLIPIPDFLYYKDQVEEINELTARISALSESLRLKGFYAAGVEDLGDAIEKALKSQDNNAIMIPLSNFAALGNQGVKDSIAWLPVVEVASVVKELIALRRQLIEDVYQITGLSDIMRGESDPNETLGAQELKSQYGSIRIRDRQQELVRVARDLTRMVAEIMAENFQPQTLLEMSQYDIATDVMAQEMMAQAQMQGQQAKPPITIEKVIALLREQRMRPFVLDIETDSTIQPDENAEKQRRTEYVTAVAGFIQQAFPLGASVPEAVPFIGETLKFLAAPYRAGRELESTIDTFVESMKSKAAQQAAAPPKPNPDEIKAKLETDKLQMETQARASELQMEGQAKAQEFQIKQSEMQAKMVMSEQQIQIEQAKLQMEWEKLDIERERLAMQRAELKSPKEKTDA